jgi:signal transduction histidine kinase
VVTYANQPWGNLFVQDETGGIGSWPWLAGCDAQPGDIIDYEGTTEQTGFGPSLRPSKITRSGKGQFPAPLKHSYGFMLTGSDDAQWIEVEGVVHRAVGNELWILIQGGETYAWVNDLIGEDGGHLVDARIQLRGVCAPVWNDKKQLVGFKLLAPTTNQITVLETAPADPFSISNSPIAELLRYDPKSATSGARSHRVKIKGVATAMASSLIFVQDESSGAKVELAWPSPVKPGDLLEVVGFAKTSGYAALLTDSLVRQAASSGLPRPVPVSKEQLFSGDYDARRISASGLLIESVVQGKTAILRLQIDNRIVRALLPTGEVAHVSIPAGSLVEARGVCSVPGLSGGTEQALPDICLNSSEDVVVVRRAPWWKLEYTLAVIGGLGLLVCGGTVWVWALRRNVEKQTRELKREIAERVRMEEQVGKTHRLLLQASRQAGMAEVATNVLHNVGNVLNSVNVSCNLVSDQIRKSDFSTLEKLADLLEKHATEPSFLAGHPKGKMIPGYLRQLAGKKALEKEALAVEVKSLNENLNHIMGIISMQQSYAKVSGLTELVAAADLVEDALRLAGALSTRHPVKVVREFGDAPPLLVDKHKALQILVNLLQNARQACDESKTPEKEMAVRIEKSGGDFVRFVVRDNGVGIAPENLTRMFAHGFTTRKDGHGFGLHSGALAAKEMGGSLVAWSEGPGRGATFTLELPREKGAAAI